MKFEEQITDLELVVMPRFYLKWKNTEEGRDAYDCYERIDLGNTIIYANIHNRNSSVTRENPFFETLENIYNKALKNNESKNDDIKREVLNDFIEHYKRSFGGGLNSQIIEVMIEEFLEKNENK